VGVAGFVGKDRTRSSLSEEEVVEIHLEVVHIGDNQSV
jgi:hypothetical protein